MKVTFQTVCDIARVTETWTAEIPDATPPAEIPSRLMDMLDSNSAEFECQEVSDEQDRAFRRVLPS